MALPLNISFSFSSEQYTGEGDYKYYPDLNKKNQERSKSCLSLEYENLQVPILQYSKTIYVS
jgi:hypothetical protein